MSDAHVHDEHDHDHEHPGMHEDEEQGWYARRFRAIEALLYEKGLCSWDEVTDVVHQVESRSPADGARVVARAWTDPDFKQRLLADPMTAVPEIGISLPENGAQLQVVENTNDVHHLVVCTLCSCYPRPLLGRPPDWYKSINYRSRAVNEPRSVMEEFGLELPDAMRVDVHDSTADLRYLVLPQRPAGTEGWSEEALAGLVSRDSMIGVTQARSPQTLQAG